jgi:hypothetical protein
MKQGSLIFCLIAIALVGCEKASEPDRQSERKTLPSVSPPLAMWSPEFKSQTLNECTQRATADANPDGVRRCKCVVEKASATIPEQRFKAIGTDPQVKALMKQIGAAC